VPDLEKHISLVRGAGIAIIGALQDFGQAERVYGRDITDTLRANFTTQIALPGLGQVEAEYYSRRLGSATVNTTAYSRTTSHAASSESATRTVSETQRALLLPEEIRTMPVGEFVMVSDNISPIRGRFKTYIERPELQDRLKLPIRRRRRVVEASSRSNGEQARPAPEQLK
jgi:type IV secretion system protein VirD4